jgi:hypothetical protein
MNFRETGSILLSIGLLCSGLSAHYLSANAAPAKVYRGTSDPDRADWQPNAVVNPKKPVKVVLINSFGEAFNYTLTGHTNSRQIVNGKTATLTNVPLPAYIAVNPIRDKINIRYKVLVDKGKNIIVLELKKAKGAGQRSLEIDRKGAIFAY